MKGLEKVLEDVDDARKRVARLREMKRLPDEDATSLLQQILSLRINIASTIDKLDKVGKEEEEIPNDDYSVAS